MKVFRLKNPMKAYIGKYLYEYKVRKEFLGKAYKAET